MALPADMAIAYAHACINAILYRASVTCSVFAMHTPMANMATFMLSASGGSTLMPSPCSACPAASP